MTSRPGKQTIVMYIFPNISRNKGNETVKFGQLIEYNIRNIITWETFFFEKLSTKCGGETILRPFFKNPNWAYLWINSVKFYTVSFWCMPVWGLSKYNKTKLRTTCFYLI